MKKVKILVIVAIAIGIGIGFGTWGSRDATPKQVVVNLTPIAAIEPVQQAEATPQHPAVQSTNATPITLAVTVQASFEDKK